MTPELVLAIDEAVIVNVTLLEKVYRKGREVLRFKKQCLSLRDDAQTLQRLLNANQNTIDKLDSTRQFKQVLEDIVTFVTTCADSTILKAVLDTLVKKQYPQLKGKMISLKEKVMFESQVTMASSTDKILSTLQPSGDQESVWSILINLKELVQQDRNRDPLKGSLAHLELGADFELDSRFKVTLDIETGQWRGEANGMGLIRLKEIPSGTSTPLYLKTYRDLQAGAFVQKYFGTILVESKLYAIMQDMKNEPSLGQVIRDGSLAKMSLVDRVRIACDVARTVAWFHAAEMLLKSLTEETVILHRVSDGILRPILVDLEASRKFMERTTNREQDVRYEAPEYRIMKQHTVHTDEWGLGTVIWQILTANHPFGIARPVSSQDDQAQTIRSNLAAGIGPGNRHEFDFLINETITDLVQDCWHSDGMLRRPASSVAEQLLSALSALSASQSSTRIITVRSNNNDAELRNLSTAVQSKFLEQIRRARVLNEKKAQVAEPKAEAKFNPEDLKLLLLDEPEWNPVKLFVVGAAIWWKLVHFDDSDGDDRFSGATGGLDENRANSALKFLDAAASAGYSEAQFERHKIYWQLSRLARMKYEQCCIRVQ